MNRENCMKLIALSLLSLAPLAAELPVREVTLYKNGVGYLLRAGEVKAGETVRLDFKAMDMNDVLKTLTVSERDGAVTQLRYDSNEPLERKLAEFPFSISEKLPLGAFLDQLRGARVEVRFGPESLSGAIVSGRTAPAEKDRGERDMLVVLLDSGELRTVDLAGAQSVRFADAAVQKQLIAYLSAVNQSHSRETRAVYIDGSGSVARQITATYLVPSAVWKSSYRLLFGDKRDPVLEGWAIVDNTSGDDWPNVRLALVSGRPVSFITELYDPRYIERRHAELPETASIGPELHQGAVAGLATPPPTAGPAPLNAPQRTYALSVAPRVELRDASSTIVAAAGGAEAGELFEYRFDAPVTIRRGESAMLPFIQQGIGARRLLILTGDQMNPLNAVELANSTGKTLDGGPVTVFDGNTYAGEALMETLKAGDKRLISYAVDLGTRVTTAFDSSRDLVHEVHLRRGLLSTRSAVQETKTFTIRNLDARAKTLVVEHAVRPEYKLLNQKPSETTARAYRFEIKLPPSGTEKFPVTEERVFENSVTVVSMTPDVLATYVQNRSLPEAARLQLERVAAKKREIADSDSALRLLQNESAETSKDQDRLRQNIESLNRVSGQQEKVQQYARDLSASEEHMAALRDRRREALQKRAELDRELNALIESAAF